MLVQALAHYADTDLNEQLSDREFEEKPVRFAINIDLEGNLLGVETRETEAILTKGKIPKTVKRVETIKIPRSPVNRNSGIYPLLACDAIDYVVGPNLNKWTKQNELDKHRSHHEGFVGLIKKAADETKNRYLIACCTFYRNDKALKEVINQLEQREAKNNNLITFFVTSKKQNTREFILEDDGIKNYWVQIYNQLFNQRHEEAGEGFCLISGKLGPIAQTHNKIKGVSKLGGRSEVSLMSFDKDAFKSYGWEQNQNSPVNPERAMAYVLALNDLLIPGIHRQGYSRDNLIRTRTDIAGTGFIYWTKEPCDEDILGLAENSQGEDVANLLDSIFKGQKTITQNIKTNDFYLLVVSGNGGRLVVRDWHGDSLERILTNIKGWFEQLCVPDVFNHGQLSSSPQLYNLIMSILPPKAKYEDEANAPKIIRMLRRAIFGFPLDRSILSAALNRLRISTGKERLKPERIGLIRICLNDIITVEKKGAIMSNQIDLNNPNLKNPACICGRLLAIYDGLQYQAHQGEVGTPVADRYYALASTYPLLAFPKIELLSKSHLRKLKRDNPAAAIAISRRIDEFASSLLIENKGKYPSQLNLEDQGRFVIGFHYQKALDAKAREEAKNKKETK